MLTDKSPNVIGYAIWSDDQGTAHKILMSESGMERALASGLRISKIVRPRKYKIWYVENRENEAPSQDDYAVWKGDGESYICSLLSPAMEIGVRENHELLKILRGYSYDEAMQMYYDLMGFGKYIPF